MSEADTTRSFLLKNFRNLHLVASCCTIPLVAFYGIYDWRAIVSIALTGGVMGSYYAAKHFTVSFGVNVLVGFTTIIELYLSSLMQTPSLRFWISGCNVCLSMFMQHPLLLIFWNLLSDVLVGYMYLVVDQRQTKLDANVMWDISLREFIAFVVFNTSVVLMMFMNLRTLNNYMYEQKILVAQLNQAKLTAEAGIRMKQDFLSTMSHEMRTPLHGLIGMVRLIERVGMSDTQCEGLDTIEYCGETLLILVNNVLDLARLEAGQLHLKSRPVQLDEIASRVIGVLQGLGKQKGTTLTYRIDSSVPTLIMGDNERLIQMVLNIAANAVKYTNKGTIKIIAKVVDHPSILLLRNASHVADLYLHSTQPPSPSFASSTKQYILFLVSDTGCGMSEADKEKVFESFEQGTDPVSGGSGLGLAICRRLVKLMGGDIGVHSELGKGSTFWFYFPLVLPPPTKQEVLELVGIDPEYHTAAILPTKSPQLRPRKRADSPQNYQLDLTAPRTPSHTEQEDATNEPHSNLPKMLLVDDNNVNLTVLQRSLQRVGYAPSDVATNGQRALDLVTAAAQSTNSKRPYDIIFVDVRMPVMDGFECTTRIRALEKNQNWPPCLIIGLSADVSEKTMHDGIASGMNHLLTKPFVIEDVVVLIRSATVNM